MEKFGKSNKGYIAGKGVFFDLESNREWLERVEKIGEVYCRQPRRTGCVICGSRFEDALFTYHGAEFYLCPSCGHLNGEYEDTNELAEFIYGEMDTGSTSNIYGPGNKSEFFSRVEEIYKPKVDFLLEAIKADGIDPKTLSYVDLGAGGGHFVAALRAEGMAKSNGYETSASLVNDANRLMGERVLIQNRVEEIHDIAANVEADVLCMIFALEHVVDLKRFLTSVRANKHIKYFYFPVPLYSPSVLMEIMFPDVMPRTLGVGHTHLFTDNSLKKMCEEFGFKRLAEWWFGGNAFDLYRYLAMQMNGKNHQGQLQTAWAEVMDELADDFQLAMDKRKMSSEIHILCSI
jgi:hypothetical protein